MEKEDGLDFLYGLPGVTRYAGDIISWRSELTSFTTLKLNDEGFEHQI